MTFFAGFTRSLGLDNFVQHLAHEPLKDRIVVITEPREVGKRWGVIAVEGPETLFSGSTTTPEEAFLLARLGLTGTMTSYYRDRHTYVPPTEALRSERTKLKELQAKEAEHARQEAQTREQARRQLLKTGAPHPVDGPEVRQVCAVAPDVIAVALQAGKHVNNQLVPYAAEPGDNSRQRKKTSPGTR